MSFLNFSDKVANHQTLSEKLTSILTTGIGGYILVFVVLALIWFLLAMIGKFFDRKQEKKTVTVVTTPVPATIPEQKTEPKTDDAATVAAIVAAISAYSGKSASEFKVVSFRKKH